tara:strand:+ start:54 stop:503 length:450 start_codon:yes stop_codon:yes gene_type:complete
MRSETFKERVISPLNSLLNKIDTLNICLHPRSEKSLYESLNNSNKIIFDSYSKSYENKNNIFIGHYSTIIFKLIAQSEKVMLIDLDWDELPNHIFDSCSLFLKWYDLNTELNNISLESINFSEPNKKFLSMFENKIYLQDIRITKKIFE